MDFSILGLWLFSVLLTIGIFHVFITPKFHARKYYEKFIQLTLFLISTFSIFITIFTIFSIFFYAKDFFDSVGLFNFLFGQNWDPQVANYQSDISDSFGFLPLLSGTAIIMLIAMLTSIPLGVFSAIFINQYAYERTRNILKYFIETLAAIPTVVYGYFAAIYVGPQIREFAELIGYSTTSESALAAGVVMGIMITPFIVSMSEDALKSLPSNLRDSSLALGMTKSESICNILLPAAFPSIMGGILLAISRAIGETMIVAMAAGLNAKMTINPLDSVTTITAQIIATISGDQEFDNVRTLSAFGLALTLFFLTLIINVCSILIVKRHKKKNA